MFLNKKMHSLYRHGKKPLNIRWSIKWRTAHKKGKVVEAKKKVKQQKKERIVKAVVGLSVEEINKLRESFTNSKSNDAERSRIAREIKEKRKQYLEKTRKVKIDRQPKQKINTKADKRGKGVTGPRH